MKKLRLYISQIVLTLVILTSSTVRGQEMLGVAFSIYSGISSAALNPALLTGTRVYIDVNIFSGNVSVANDMFYFTPENKTLGKAIRQDTSLMRNGPFNWNRTYTYYQNPSDKYFTANVKLIGPSLMIQADRHAFGFSTSFRTIQSGNHIPSTMPITMYEGLSYAPYHGEEVNTEPYSFASLSWSEIALSYAYNFFDQYSNRLTFGITAKALFGYEGGYIDMRNSNYIIHNEDDIEFKNIDAEIAYALPVTYDTNITTNYGPLVKGYGAGMDIGIVFTKLKSTLVYERNDKLCARPFNDYKYKIGISVLDVGSITFKNNAEVHRFDNVSKYWVDFDTIQFRGIKDAIQNYSRGFYDGDSDASLTGNTVKVGLPTTISLQFDYHLRSKLYISALWMHPLKFNSQTAWRPAQLAIVPRYENRMMGISLPVSLFNYEDPRVGLAVRFYTMTIGTDRLGSLLGISNFNGMDIYFSFRFNIGKGACSSYQKDACSNQRFGNDW